MPPVPVEVVALLVHPILREQEQEQEQEAVQV